jgi:dihydroneopterin aldolase
LIDRSLPTRLAQLPPVQFAKIGLAGCRACRDWIPRWRWAIERLPTGTSPVAVTYADADRAVAPDAVEIHQQALRLGCSAMLWDTYDKTRGRLLDHVTVEKLASQVWEVRRSGMLVVLAGSLAIDDLAALQVLTPDFVAVRGAVCAGSRTNAVDQQLVERFVQQMRTLPNR